MTSVPQSLPEGWRLVRLGDVLRLQNGHAFKTSEWTRKGRPIIRIQNLKSATAPYNYFSGELPERFRATKGDLLFAWSGTPGTSFGAHVWNGPDAWVNQHIFRVDFSPELFDRDFLKLALDYNLESYIADAQGGVGLAHITKAKLNESFLVAPPLDQQREIARCLQTTQHKRESSSRHLIAARRTIERFRKAILAAACSGRLTANWRGDSIAQDYPISWKALAFRDLIESSFYGPRFASDEYVSDGIPTIRTTDMDSYGNIVLRDPPRVALGPSSLEKYRLLDGDLLVTRTGSIGKCAVYSGDLGPALPSAYLIRFRLRRTSIMPHFALFFLMSPLGQQALIGGSTATTTPNVNAQAVGDIELCLPPLDEQWEIMHRVIQMLSATDALAERIEAALGRVDRCSEAILAKAFRGELLPTPIAPA